MGNFLCGDMDLQTNYTHTPQFRFYNHGSHEIFYDPECCWILGAIR